MIRTAATATRTISIAVSHTDDHCSYCYCHHTAPRHHLIRDEVYAMYIERNIFFHFTEKTGRIKGSCLY